MPENIKYRLKILMQKYLDRTCTPEERDELVRLISQTTGPEEVNDLWQNVWAETDGSVSYDDLSWESLQEINAIARRSPMKLVWKKALKWSAAAAVLIGLYFMVDWAFTGEDTVIYKTGYGETLEIVLDDGTRVNLNADSRLTWDADWKHSGMRQVNLEGEAYFDVSHVDKNGSMETSVQDSLSRLPFEVVTPDLTITVLGTAFNALQRRGKTEVFLERGSVELALHRDKVPAVSQTNKNKNNNLETQHDLSGERIEQGIIRMNPGDFVSFSSKEDALVQKTIMPAEELSDWKEGVLSYQDKPFSDMLQNLEDLYGKTFEVEDSELFDKRVHFSMPYKDWSTVKEMMELMLGVEILNAGEDKVKIKKRIENEPVK